MISPLLGIDRAILASGLSLVVVLLWVWGLLYVVNWRSWSAFYYALVALLLALIILIELWPQ